MAIAIFHSTRGKTGTMSLILVKANLLVGSAEPVFVPTKAVDHYAGRGADELQKGDQFTIPDGFRLVDVPLIKEGKRVVNLETGKKNSYAPKQVNQ